MKKPLRILHLEDEPDYSDLVRSLLATEDIQAEVLLVSSRAEFEAALALESFDLILADYSLPSYDGLQALKCSRERCPETPFLLISGTIGEQAAIESLKTGATDYVLKHWPERLVPSIRRAVKEAEDRKQRRLAETELQRREDYFRALTENSLDILTILSGEGLFVYNSPSIKRVLGYEPHTLTGQSAFALVHPDDLTRVVEAFQTALKNSRQAVTLDFRFRHREGSWRYLEAIGQSRAGEPDIAAVVVNVRDVTDRKKAEEDLRESEKQYRLIFDGNPTPMWVFDQESLEFLEVNDAAVQHFGYSRDEFLAMRLPDLRPPEDVPALMEYLHTLLPAGTPTTLGMAGIWPHRRKDGSHIEVEIKWSPISFKGRSGCLVMANDVTERKRIEHRDAAISKLGQSLSSASSPAEAALIIRGVADELFQWNTFTLDLYSTEQNLVYPILNIDTDPQGRRFQIPVTTQGRKPSEVAQKVASEGAELILEGEPAVVTNGESAIRDCSRASASLMVAPIRNRTKVIGILSVKSYTPKAYSPQDLNTLQTLADHCGGALERMSAEQALHESEMLFHSVWENSVDGMRITDENGIMVAVNEPFCKLVGMPRHDLEGQPLTVIYAESEQPERMLQRYKKRFQDRVIDKLVERRVTLRNGQVLTIEDTSSLVELHGRPSLLLALFRDVTTQKRLEEQLRQSQKMEAIGQLAGGVAHDFNNILTVIHGHASLLLAGGTLSGVSAKSAQQVAHAADRAAGLTRQLLAFSRRQVMQPRRLDMNEVVCNMTKMLSRILGEDIALQLNYFPQPTVVQADASMMEQVLLNLAVNSRDAMPKGGQLAIKISVRDIEARHVANHPEASMGKFVCLSVIDTGCGIPAENLRRVFEPFFTTKEVGKGTGLGLATVYGIIKQHNGWVEVESQPGNGATFEVFLPCAGGSVELTEERIAERPVPGGEETILVVEDEEPVRELVCNLLASHGYKVLRAESGVQALEIWKQSKDSVDLVLTDLVMPDRINGRELAEKLWGERPTLKVIFMSGYSADVVGADFVLKRGVNYLQKPYHPRKLALMVRDCLDAVN